VIAATPGALLGPARRAPVATPWVASARRWALPYLLAAVMLAPVVNPAGPGQTAVLDLLNLLALIGFALGQRRKARPVTLPLLLPLLLIAAGSLLATAGAASLGATGLTLAQDLYLYLWFVMLVSLMHERGDLKALRVAWFWTASGVALVGLIGLPRAGLTELSGLAGPRAAATLYNPNMCADYLVLSVFNALSLADQVRARWRGLSLGLLLVALMATKSNGGWVCLGLGLAVWAILRIAAGGAAAPRIAGLIAVVLATALVAGWSLWEGRSGEAWARRMVARTYLVRIEHSSDTREAIWRGLVSDLRRSPLGIGPGNSAARELAIGERLRPDSFRAKEAHSDYLAYAAERGPLGLAGLLLATAAVFVRVWRGGAALTRRSGSARRAAAIRAALLGALVATTVHSLVIEKLHFRHAWLFLAMAWTLTGAPDQPWRVVASRNGLGHAGRGTRWRGEGEPAARPAARLVTGTGA